MKILSLILNIPWTILGFVFVLISGPTNIQTNKNPVALVFKVKSLWWYEQLPSAKGIRAMAIGNVVLLGPKELEKDLEHELVHVEQGMRVPLVHPFLYWIEMMRFGYRENKYEKEAYGRAGNRYISR